MAPPLSSPSASSSTLPTTSSIPPFSEHTPITPQDITLLALFLTLWSYVYYRAVLSPKTGTPHGFDSSTFISNLHSVPLCVLAFLSLQQSIPETVPLWWSVSFFLIDLLDTIVRKDAMWGFHAVISLVLNLGTGCNARHRMLRTVSKGFFAEASTLFLNHWKKSKSYTSFLIFFLVFTSCRMIWVPTFLYTTYAIHLNGEIDVLIWPSILFYILQLVWYTNMCAMVVSYRIPSNVQERLEKGKEEAPSSSFKKD
eukprot:CAMPEP_0183769670 /NCGR_PEP_ID=MMETSP0739-20130205/22817_1 /TAXON_ID=385413 /ORGANISM="Thalassiosira miniscula, Strain CCMP1093" /LENGTH=253 /DNA_ID=CAMNT_0026009347 /DNA_START=7 /DNA_END=768 /DNA_ORIENTATION=+